MRPDRTIAITRTPLEHRVALVEDGCVVEVEIERRSGSPRAGDLYVGRLRRAMPGLDAAFIDLGDERPAFLPVPASTRSQLGALQRGRSLLVQVAKAPLGGKGARLSAQPVLSSRFWVLNTGSTGIAISRKVSDAGERERLRAIGARAGGDGCALIARTASVGRGDAELLHDAQALVDRWHELVARSATVAAPHRLLPELDLPFRWLRDHLDRHGTRVLVDHGELADEIAGWLSSAGSGAGIELSVTTPPADPFAVLGVDRALSEATSRKVRLPSGGHVTIDPTEALTAIDVDTGRSVGKRDVQQTILDTNLEAARAIARQLRLRNLGGIVVIDFIDMAIATHRERVLNELRGALSADPSPTDVLPFTPLGLVQLTRKRTRPALHELLTATCPRCGGSGHVPSAAALGSRALAALESRVGEASRTALVVRAAESVVEWLRHEAAGALQALERKLGRSIVIRTDERLDGRFVVEPPLLERKPGTHPEE